MYYQILSSVFLTFDYTLSLHCLHVYTFVHHLQEYHHSFGLTEGVNDSSPSCQEKKLYECSGNVFIYGYKETNLNNQLNDKSTLGYNKIFESGI